MEPSDLSIKINKMFDTHHFKLFNLKTGAEVLPNYHFTKKIGCMTAHNAPLGYQCGSLLVIEHKME